MGKIIEAKAVISAEDRTGAVLDGIKRKFNEVGKGAKVSAEVGRLAKQLDAANNSLRNIDKFRGTQATFGQAREHFRGAQQQVSRLAKELDGARKAAAAFDGIKSFSKGGTVAKEAVAARKRVATIEKALSTAQRSVKAASEVYDAQASALKSARHHAEASGVSVAKLATEQARLKAVVDDTNAAMLKQSSIQKAGSSMAAGMGAAGRQTSDQIALSRRMADGMSAAGRGERDARERQARDKAQAEIQRRATASGDMVAGMGGAGRRTSDRIEQGRRVAQGMGAAGRVADDERGHREMLKAEAQAQRTADRREAAKTAAEVTSLYLTHKGKELGLQAIDAAADMDYAVRYQHAVTDVTEADQKRLLIPQAKRIGQETKFSNRDIVEAQTATMQGLPFKDPAMKAEVGAAIVDQSRYYAVLFKASMERTSEGIRSFLQNTNKDISTPDKAIAEARRSTNLIVKASKLGGANDEDAQQFMKFGLPTMIQAGFKDTTALSMFSTARRSGLKGDEAGVFGRAAASKLIAPTREGREAEIMAGIDRSKFQKMPEQLNAEAFGKLGKGRFGVSFNGGQKQRLSNIFRNGDLVTDREEFIKQVTTVVGESFDKVSKGPNKGKLKAQDSAKIAKLANDFHKMSVESTDVEGLWNAHLNSPTFTAALRNKFYTDKHGGKFGMIMSHGDQFRDDRDQLLDVDKTPNFAKDKADYLTKGPGGSRDNLKGSWETMLLEWGTKMAPITQVVSDGLAATGDAIANLPDRIVQAGTLIGVGAGAGASAASTLSILGKLTGSTALTGIGAGVGTATLAGTAVAGGALAGAMASEIAKNTVKDRDFADPYLQGGMLGADPAGYGLGAAIVHADMLGRQALTRSGSLPPGTSGKRPAGAEGVPSLIDAGRQNTAASVESARKALAGYRQELETLRSESNGLSDLGLPGVGGGQDARVAQVEGQIRQAEERLKGLRQNAPSASPAPFVPPAGDHPPLPSRMVPTPPARPVEFGGRTIPVEVVSLPAGADPSGQERAIGNTLGKAAEASSTAANGGRPIEATVRPDQITARVTEMPPVTGEATVTVDNHHQVLVTFNTDMLKAEVRSEVSKAMAKVSFNSGSPMAKDMQGTRTLPGDAFRSGR